MATKLLCFIPVIARREAPGIISSEERFACGPVERLKIMHIISGAFRGKRLWTPRGQTTRPTSAKV
ncbi:MAG: RsmD family RNA methyltransferase, partial [Candidatus Latescibacteria bacterium]|nr:RsmD family RNA methyltransferase [Candidatus Latescibacterota bacterium]